MNHLVEDVLSLSRIGSAGISLAPAKARVREVVQKVYHTVR